MKTFISTLFYLLVLHVSAQTVTITGTVTDPFETPLNGVNIQIGGTRTGTQTDFDGFYTLEARIGQNLIFTHVGMKKTYAPVKNDGAINIVMFENPEEIGTVYLETYGKTRSEKLAPISVTTLKAADIENKAQSDLMRNINGKVPGTQIIPISGALGSGTNMVIRSKSSISGDNNPLFVVDGMPFSSSTNNVAGFAGGIVTSSRILDLDPNNIASVQVLRGLSATILYGQEGRNGVVLIKTKTGSFTSQGLAPELPYSERFLNAQEKARTALANERTPKELGYESAFQEVVKTILNSNDRLAQFLVYEIELSGDPTFYIDMYDRFEKIDPDFAEKVLQAMAEVRSEHVPLLKALAYKLEAEDSTDLAIKLYKKLLTLRPNDPQSYRDLALAQQRMGNTEAALVQLKHILGSDSPGDFSRIVGSEFNNLIRNNPELIDNGMDNVKSIKDSNGFDLRVVIDWNRDDANLDLQLIDPNLEVCSIDRPKTRSGGTLLSNNETGFGPEVFELKTIQSGSYYLKVGFGSETKPKLEIPTYVKLTIFRNYGRSNETFEIKLIKIDAENDLQLMDRIAVL